MPRFVSAAVLLVASLTVAVGATPPVVADGTGAAPSGCSSAPPILQLANPNPGDVLSQGELIVSGVAYDPAAPSTAGIARVDLFLGDRNSGGAFLGSTAQGADGRSLDRQFQVKAFLPANSTGGRDFVAYAYSSITGEWSSVSVPVFIGAAPSASSQDPLQATSTSSCESVVANPVGSLPSTNECAVPSQTPPAPPPAGFTDRTVDVSGVTMHYVIGGSGHEVVVLLHGWPENWYEWRMVMPRLAQQFTVIAVDLPGFGDSRGSPSSYDAKTLASYVHGLVADALGYRRVNIVGHDWGAPVAFAYAAFFRDSASTLSLMGFPGSLMGFPFFPGPGTDVQAVRSILWWFGFNSAPSQMAEQLVAGRQKTYMGWLYENAVAPGFRMDPVAVTEYLRTYCKPNVLHSGFEIYRAEPADVADNVPLADDKLTLPVLYMDLTVARLGTLPDNADARQALVAPIQAMVAGRINVQLVPGAGHFVADENPDFVSAQLTSFVNANSPR